MILDYLVEDLQEALITKPRLSTPTRHDPGPTPTTSIYNASVVIFYNATGSQVRFESLKIILV
jgi:hypothetical protein